MAPPSYRRNCLAAAVGRILSAPRAMSFDPHTRSWKSSKANEAPTIYEILRTEIGQPLPPEIRTRIYVHISEAITFAQLASMIENEIWMRSFAAGRRMPFDISPWAFQEVFIRRKRLDVAATHLSPYFHALPQMSMAAGGMQSALEYRAEQEIRRWLWKVLASLRQVDESTRGRTVQSMIYPETAWDGTNTGRWAGSASNNDSATKAPCTRPTLLSGDSNRLIDELSTRLAKRATMNENGEDALLPESLEEMGMQYIARCEQHATKILSADRTCAMALRKLATARSVEDACEFVVAEQSTIEMIVQHPPPNLMAELERFHVSIDALDFSNLAHMHNCSIAESPVALRGEIAYAWAREHGRGAVTACGRFLEDLERWKPLSSPFLPTIEQVSNASHGSSVVLPSPFHLPMNGTYVLVSSERVREGTRTGLDPLSERLVRLLSVVWELLHRYDELKPGILWAGLVSDVALARRSESILVEKHLRQRIITEGLHTGVDLEVVDQELQSDGQFDDMVAMAAQDTRTMQVGELTHFRDRINYIITQKAVDHNILNFANEMGALIRINLSVPFSSIPEKLSPRLVLDGLKLTLDAVLVMRGRLKGTGPSFSGLFYSPNLIAMLSLAPIRRRLFDDSASGTELQSDIVVSSQEMEQLVPDVRMHLQRIADAEAARVPLKRRGRPPKHSQLQSYIKDHQASFELRRSHQMGESTSLIVRDFRAFALAIA